MKALYWIAFAAFMTVAGFIQAQSPRNQAIDQKPARERLIGAWRLVHIESPGPDKKSVDLPQPIGMLIYTRDGHMSVQLMYPKLANVPSNEYVQDGYEASFGSYEVNEATHTLTHHVQGSNTRDLIVGKDLPRLFNFNEKGQLVIRPARPDEHWFVIWEHY